MLSFSLTVRNGSKRVRRKNIKRSCCGGSDIIEWDKGKLERERGKGNEVRVALEKEKRSMSKA